jgi:hypothetical protein
MRVPFILFMSQIFDWKGKAIQEWQKERQSSYVRNAAMNLQNGWENALAAEIGTRWWKK